MANTDRDEIFTNRKRVFSAVHAYERNRLFLYGRSFTLINDNKAVINILNNPKSNTPPKIERLLLKLQGYDFEAEYVLYHRKIRFQTI